MVTCFVLLLAASSAAIMYGTAIEPETPIWVFNISYFVVYTGTWAVLVFSFILVSQVSKMDVVVKNLKELIDDQNKKISEKLRPYLRNQLAPTKPSKQEVTEAIKWFYAENQKSFMRQSKKMLLLLVVIETMIALASVEAYFHAVLMGLSGIFLSTAFYGYQNVYSEIVKAGIMEEEPVAEKESQ